MVMVGAKPVLEPLAPVLAFEAPSCEAVVSFEPVVLFEAVLLLLSEDMVLLSFVKFVYR